MVEVKYEGGIFLNYLEIFFVKKLVSKYLFYLFCASQPLFSQNQMLCNIDLICEEFRPLLIGI